MRLVAYYGRPDHSPDLAKACFYTGDDFHSFEVDASRKPRKRVAGTKRRQQRATIAPFADDPCDDVSRGRHVSVFEYDFYSDEDDTADLENLPQQHPSEKQPPQCKAQCPLVAPLPLGSTPVPSKGTGHSIQAPQAAAATQPTVPSLPAAPAFPGFLAASASVKAGPLVHTSEPPCPPPPPQPVAGGAHEARDPTQAHPNRREARLMSEIHSSELSPLALNADSFQPTSAYPDRCYAA